MSSVDQQYEGRLYTEVEIGLIRLRAQLGMIDYYDQAPSNDSCDWKGLLADNRQVVEYEISKLTKEEAV